jgi:hypothetical protein
MGNALVKDLINDAVGKVFDELESELEKQEENIKGCFDVIRAEIKSTKEKVIMNAIDVVEEENERIVKLLKKSGINSKQKVIERLSGE